MLVLLYNHSDDRQLDDALRLGSSDRGPGSPEIRRNIDGASSTFLLEIEHNTVDYGRPNRLGQPVPRGTSYCRSLCPELDNARHLVRAPSWRVPCSVLGVEVAKVRSVLVHGWGHLVLCFRHRRRKDALYRISRDGNRVCELLDLRSPSTPAAPVRPEDPAFKDPVFTAAAIGLVVSGITVLLILANVIPAAWLGPVCGACGFAFAILVLAMARWEIVR